ncbi:uncharacterized protein N7511_010425 [Penicillium nucicola]|uniref:uncharacterized protein n=1 Tax=Penicillium nucicola TaxID=1850975 RepID=UPI002544D794|nr:uncharacterized protein N7511_010425 [Penicillium nucicola]KAJ5748729.1 hypothetical protein N7511_010425 [Penicillium nucicola]
MPLTCHPRQDEPHGFCSAEYPVTFRVAKRENSSCGPGTAVSILHSPFSALQAPCSAGRVIQTNNARFVCRTDHGLVGNQCVYLARRERTDVDSPGRDMDMHHDRRRPGDAIQHSALL